MCFLRRSSVALQLWPPISSPKSYGHDVPVCSLLRSLPLHRVIHREVSLDRTITKVEEHRIDSKECHQPFILGIAIFALMFTYFLWIRSVKTGSVFWSSCTALSYFYMVRRRETERERGWVIRCPSRFQHGVAMSSSSTWFPFTPLSCWFFDDTRFACTCRIQSSTFWVWFCPCKSHSLAFSPSELVNTCWQPVSLPCCKPMPSLSISTLNYLVLPIWDNSSLPWSSLSVRLSLPRWFYWPILVTLHLGQAVSTRCGIPTMRRFIFRSLPVSANINRQHGHRSSSVSSLA